MSDVHKVDGEPIVGAVGDGVPLMGSDGAKYRLLGVDTQGHLLFVPLAVAAGAYGPVAVAAVATLIRAANTNRKLLRLIHQSTQTLYVGFDAAVSTVSGLPLISNQPWEERLYTGAVYGISDGAAIDVRFEEL